MKSDILDLEVHLHHETELAVKVSTDGDDDNAVWIPKSWIELAKDPKHKSVHIMSIPEHFAIDKGLL